jgi:hypothetical protein
MKNVNYFFYSALLLITWSVAQPAFAFRCDGKVIKKGDFHFEVVEHCGEPEAINTRRFLRTQRTDLAELSVNQLPDNYIKVGAQQQITEEVIVEDWFYNFGRNRFSQKITFENGAIVRIESLGYGY